MALVKLVEYAEAAPEVRAVYEDIMKTRNVDWVNNFGRRSRMTRRTCAASGRTSSR